MGLKFTDMYEFPVKSFFWALGGEFVFREMPDLTEQHDGKIDLDTTFFQGTPNQVLGKKEGEGDDDDNAAAAGGDGGDGDDDEDPKAKNSDDSSEEEVKVPTRDLTGK